MLLTDIMSDEWNPNMKRRLIKNKSDRKRRKVSAIRQQHNLSAHRARALDEEKRRRDAENQRLARQRNPQRRAAANSLFWCGWWVVTGGWRTFFVFKSLDNNMVYTFDIDVYVCKRNRCTTKVLWVLKF